jgi:hypothetical protein
VLHETWMGGGGNGDERTSTDFKEVVVSNAHDFFATGSEMSGYSTNKQCE